MGQHAAGLHKALVDHLLAISVLTQPAVEAAFRAVPRHVFLPGVPLEDAYRDDAIPTKMADGRAISSSSQPAIMAIMLEQLGVQPGQRVLEIGAGTGYNAALLSQLVGPSGLVVTVDIDDDIVEAARAHLAEAGVENVRVVLGDGGEGYAPDQPYDRIILTVGAWDITPAWHEQLAAGGRLVLPLKIANGAQNSIVFDKIAPDRQPILISQAVQECGFMPLRGAFAGPEVFTPLGTQSGLTLISPGEVPAASDRIYEWLMAGGERGGTGLLTTEAAVYGSLALWLDLHSGQVASLMIEDASAPPGGWPCLFQWGTAPATCFTFLKVTADGMAALDGRDHSTIEPSTAASDLGPFELKVIEYGPRGHEVAQSLLDLLADWNGAGRPPSARLRVRVFSRDHPYAAALGETIVTKRWTKLVVDWPSKAAAQS